jgi:hypothetical protein
VADDIEPSPSGVDSPWARDVPVAPPPTFPVAWAGRRDDSNGLPADDRPPDPVVDHPPGTDSSVRTLTRRRRSVLVGGVLGVMAMVAIGTQVIGGGERPADGVRAGVNEGATFDSQVWFPDTEPPSSTARATDGADTTVATLPEPEPQWVTSQVELSPAVQAITQPTEVIALNDNGTLIAIAIPSGEVHTIDTERSSETVLGLGPQVIVLLSIVGGESMLTSVGRPLTSIDVPDGVGPVARRPGVDEFVVMSNPVSPSSTGRPFLLAGDGTLTELFDEPFVDASPGGFLFLPTGEVAVRDSGGVYVVDASGTSRRLTDGDLIAIGPNQYLLKECTDNLVCTYLRVDAITGERSPVELDLSDRYVGGSLSPDGSSLSYVEFGGEVPLQRIVDLDTGVVTELDTARSYGFFFGTDESIWAADSSGVFAINNTQIVFFDRTTGEATPVAPNEDFGDVVAVAARPLVSSPADP